MYTDLVFTFSDMNDNIYSYKYGTTYLTVKNKKIKYKDVELTESEILKLKSELDKQLKKIFNKNLELKELTKKSK